MSTLPCLEQLAPNAVLLLHGRVCIKPPAVLDALYQNEAAISIASAPTFQPSFVWCDWQELVSGAILTNDEIRIMIWIRSLSAFHLPVAGAYCPLCRFPVRSWVEHFTAACAVFIIAAAVAFRAVLDEMQVDEWSVEATSLWDGNVDKSGSSLVVSLLWEGFQDWPGDLGGMLVGLFAFITRIDILHIQFVGPFARNCRRCTFKLLWRLFTTKNLYPY
jgi:hypothetical protein